MENSKGLRDPVLIIVGILGILLIVQYAREIVVPFLLSIFIAIVLTMPVGWLKNRGLSVPLSVTIVLIATLVLEVLLAVMLGNTIGEFNKVLPSYQARIGELELAIVEKLSSFGIDLEESGVLAAMDPNAVLGLANNLMTGIGDVLSNAMLIMFTVLFMLLETKSFPLKIQAIQDIQNGKIANEITKVLESTQDYIAVKAFTSLATGVLVWIGLAFVGLDFAALWGFLAFALNFIPTIGSILAAVPAVLVAMVQLSPFDTTLVIAIFLAVNMLIGNVVEPAIMGRRVGLSTLVVFLSLVFWGWLLGPVGMLLSVPLTMIIKFASEASDQTRWIAILLGTTPKSES